MVLTFTYRLYPTQAQETQLYQYISHLCELHNSARLNRIRAYEETGQSVSYADQCRLLTQARARHEDFRAVPQEFQKHALQRVNKAFANFFRMWTKSQQKVIPCNTNIQMRVLCLYHG